MMMELLFRSGWAGQRPMVPPNLNRQVVGHLRTLSTLGMSSPLVCHDHHTYMLILSLQSIGRWLVHRHMLYYYCIRGGQERVVYTMEH